MFGLGTPEILLIGIAVLLLFGAKKIPELMRGLGSGIKEFKKASTIEENQDKENTPLNDTNKK
jgi:sec-independent protein translocase protein TatA